jgi:hypothetical protein
VKKKSIRIIAVLAASFLIVSLMGMACIDELKAAGGEDDEKDYPIIVEQLAEKLDLDPEKVFEAFNDINMERKEELEKNLGHKLDRAVEEEYITEEQKEALAAKKKEVSEQFQQIKDLPPGEKKEALKDIAADLKEWLEENDIDFKHLFPVAGMKLIRAKRSMFRHILRFFTR